MLTANLPLVLCFKVSQLLAFYGSTVEQMMGSGAHLTDTLADCHKLATRVFHEQLKARGNKLMQFNSAPPTDLSVPQQACTNTFQALCLCPRPLVHSVISVHGNATHEHICQMYACMQPAIEATPQANADNLSCYHPAYHTVPLSPLPYDCCCLESITELHKPVPICLVACR